MSEHADSRCGCPDAHSCGVPGCMPRSRRLARAIQGTHALGRSAPADPRNLLWLQGHLYRFHSKHDRAECVAEWCYDREHGGILLPFTARKEFKGIRVEGPGDGAAVVDTLADGVAFLSRRMSDELLVRLLSTMCTPESFGDLVEDLVHTTNDLLRFLDRDEVVFEWHNDMYWNWGEAEAAIMAYIKGLEDE